MKDLVIYVRYIVVDNDPDEYSSNWINNKISKDEFIKVPVGSRVSDLCEKLKTEAYPFVFCMKPFIGRTAAKYGIMPTEIDDGTAEPMDTFTLLDGSETFDIIYGNLDKSNVKGFIRGL